MPIRVGFDLVAVESVEALLHGPLAARYLERIFAEHEVASSLADGSVRPDKLAACFAVKEAVVKVLPGSSVLQGRNIQLRVDPPGPRVVLAEPLIGLARRSGLRELRVSVACRGGYAAALVLADLTG